MSNGQQLMLTITPNFMMTWTNEEEE